MSSWDAPFTAVNTAKDATPVKPARFIDERRKIDELLIAAKEQCLQLLTKPGLELDGEQTLLHSIEQITYGQAAIRAANL